MAQSVQFSVYLMAAHHDGFSQIRVMNSTFFSPSAREAARDRDTVLFPSSGVAAGKYDDPLVCTGEFDVGPEGLIEPRCSGNLLSGSLS